MAGRSGAQGALRDRLYQRGATTADVEAYIASISTTTDVDVDVDVDVDERLVPTTVAQRRLSRRGLVIGAGLGSVALALGVPALLPRGSERVNRAPRHAVPVLAVIPILGEKGQQRAGAALSRAPRGDVQPLLDLIGPSLPTLRSSGVAVLTGHGVGSEVLPLGPFGITAAGRGVQVVVATPRGRYGWVIAGRTRAWGRTDLLRARTVSGAVVSGAGGAVPAGATELSIRFDVPENERFVYYLVATG